jgi:hypothetical protein
MSHASGNTPRPFKPPTEAQVADYAAGLGLPDPPAAARQFIACYAPAWRDTFGRPVRNWKLKFRQVWAVRRQRPKRRTKAPPRPRGDWLS